MSGLTPAPAMRVHDPSGVDTHGVALWSGGQSRFRSARVVIALLVPCLAVDPSARPSRARPERYGPRPPPSSPAREGRCTAAAPALYRAGAEPVQGLLAGLSNEALMRGCTLSCTQSGHEAPLRPTDDPDYSIPARGRPCGLRVRIVAAVGFRGCCCSLQRADPSQRQQAGAHRQGLLLPVHESARRQCSGRANYQRAGWANQEPLNLPKISLRRARRREGVQPEQLRHGCRSRTPRAAQAEHQRPD